MTMNLFSHHKMQSASGPVPACSGSWKFAWIILFACLLQFFSSSAFAHASLIESQPADAAVLGAAPGEFVLHFNEPVAPLVFKLVSPDGAIRPLDQTTVIPDGLKIILPKMTAAGTYLFSWRVVSADGHPVGGALTYAVGVQSAGASSLTSSIASTVSAASASAPMLTAVIWLSRFGLYLSLFFSIGGVAFRAFFAEDASPKWINALIVFSWLLLPVALGAQGLDALSASWDQLGSLPPWKTSLGTTYGMTIGVMLAASIAAWLGNIGLLAGRRVASAVAICLLGLALASSGHAASAPPTWLARPTVFLHAVAIALWVGSLLPLMLSLHKARGPRLLAAFSRIVPWVLVVLLLSGLILATLQLPRLSDLWLSDYGKILCVKLVLLTLLLLVAAGNRYVLTGRVENGDVQATRWMKRLIVVEVMLVLLILAAATTWRFTPPPRAQAITRSVVSHVHIHTAQAMADVTLMPQADHRMTAEAFLADADGVPLKAKEVVVRFSDPQDGLEPLEVAMQLGENQTWRTKPFVLPATGRWHIRIDALVSDFESIGMEGEVSRGQ